MSELSSSEIGELRELLEKEKIRKVKQLYSHLMDSNQIDALADLFTEDAICEFGPEYGTWEGRETIRTNYKGVFAEFNRFDAMHHVTNHYIDILGPDTAEGRSYLHDVMTTVEPEGQPVVWYGLYDEDYRKVDGTWLISRSTLQFLWPQKMVTNTFEEPYPSVD
ncbi:MAG: nuclear transport factor 2 family protein [Candidatus Azotimanducaceae bacterium]